MKHESFLKLCQLLLTTYQKGFIRKTTPFTSILKIIGSLNMPTSRKNDDNNEIIGFGVGSSSSSILGFDNNEIIDNNNDDLNSSLN